MSVLRELIGDCAIEALPITFTAVATDLGSREEVWLREGQLFDAIRASIATPLVFTPFKHGRRTLLDGALVNPVPIAPTLEDATDLTVAVNLSGPEESRALPPVSASLISDNSYRKRIARFIDGLQAARVPREPRQGLLDVAFTSMQAMQDTISQLRLAAYAPDVRIEIPRNACGFFEFWRAEELIELGRERAAQAFEHIER
jgi:NTE family protein